MSHPASKQPDVRPSIFAQIIRIPKDSVMIIERNGDWRLLSSEGTLIGQRRPNILERLFTWTQKHPLLTLGLLVVAAFVVAAIAGS